jgi:hypothetical protein
MPQSQEEAQVGALLEPCLFAAVTLSLYPPQTSRIDCLDLHFYSIAFFSFDE